MFLIDTFIYEFNKTDNRKSNYNVITHTDVQNMKLKGKWDYHGFDLTIVEIFPGYQIAKRFFI